MWIYVSDICIFQNGLNKSTCQAYQVGWWTEIFIGQLSQN